MPQGIHGVVLLDKPEGISSQTAVTIVKRAFDAEKAGHTGTLDPMATGLLPVCLGEATKYSQDLLDADKTYLATIKFGEKTTTGDAEGEVVEVRVANFDVTDEKQLQEKLAEVLLKFTGEIAQVPPMYSALKRDGKPLYEYARAGETLEREARHVTIHSLKWIKVEWPVAQLEVNCSKGTYVRTLA
ncbi:MAG: tRNA pseudouridine(55) synthase TruB, partial [Polynucleobacter victoriensis]